MGKKQRLLPTQGDSEGLDPRVVLPLGFPYPLWKGLLGSLLSACTKMRRCRKQFSTVRRRQLSPQWRPLAGSDKAPLSADRSAPARAHWLERVRGSAGLQTAGRVPEVWVQRSLGWGLGGSHTNCKFADFLASSWEPGLVQRSEGYRSWSAALGACTVKTNQLAHVVMRFHEFDLRCLI